MISKELKRAVGHYISFTQTSTDGCIEGYVDKACVSKTYHAYWSRADNPRCRSSSGDIRPVELPTWADYGWLMTDGYSVWYKDLRILDEEDLGKW